MIKQTGILIGAALVFWALVALPAGHFWGNATLIFSGTALLLCLVPAVLTMLWAGWAFRNSKEQQMLMILAGTGLRLFAVGAAALFLYLFQPYYQHQQAFLGWLLICYLFVLVLEKLLVLKGRLTANEAGASGPKS